MPSEINQTEKSRLSFYSHCPKNAFKYFYYSIFIFFYCAKCIIKTEESVVRGLAEGRGGGEGGGKSPRIESIPCGGIKKCLAKRQMVNKPQTNRQHSSTGCKNNNNNNTTVGVQRKYINNT